MTKVAFEVSEDTGHFINQAAQTGGFKDASDFVLNLIENVKAQSETELSEEEQVKLSVLRSEIDIGIKQAERGEFVEFTAEEILERGRRKRAAIAS